MLPQPADRAGGFTLVELMIAITLSLLIISGLVALFISSSDSTRKLDDSARQIENGQYALSRLEWEFSHAGYLSYFNPDTLATPSIVPNPCVTSINDVPNAVAGQPDEPGLLSALPIHVQGYDGGDNTLGCAPNQVAGSDIIVIRRAAVCVTGSADCGTIAGAPYFQASSCQTELAQTANRFRLTTNRGALDLTERDCATVEEDRRYIVNLFYVRDFYETAGDGVPTLVRAQLDPGALNGFVVTPLAKDIETLQIEYGIDNTGDGTPDLFTPDPTGAGCVGSDCAQLWRDTMAAKVYLLSRTNNELARPADTKTFTLGLDADGNPNEVLAAGDRRQRNVFHTMARLNNPAIRRE